MLAPKITIVNEEEFNKYYIYRGTPETLSNNLKKYISLNPICTYENKDETIKQIDIYDNRQKEQNENIHMYGTNPITINKPTVLCKNIKYKTINGLYTKYLIKLSDINNPIDISYRIIGENEKNELSISDLISVEIKQPIGYIKAWIEYQEGTEWNKLMDIDPTQDNIILGNHSNEYKRLNGIFITPIHDFSEDFISFDNKYVTSDNLTIIKIKNVWYKHYKSNHYRKTIPLRVGCSVLDGNKLYSERINDEEEFVPLDKLVILRKEVIDGDENNISITDNDATVIQIIRAGGIYYNSEFETLQFNEENIYNDYSVVNYDTHLKTINIIDRGILQNKIYKYTFIYYDNTGECSLSYTIVNK